MGGDPTENMMPLGILGQSPSAVARATRPPGTPVYANVEKRHLWTQKTITHGTVFMTLCAPHVQQSAAEFMSNRKGTKKPCKRCARARR